MRITKKITIEQPIDNVWKIVAEDFDKASIWMAAIPNSYAHEAGQPIEGAPMAGRICELTPKKNGPIAEETITAYDEIQHSMHVLIVPKNTNLPILKNNLHIKLNVLAPNKTEIIWDADLSLKTMGKLLYPALKLGIGKSFTELLEELKYYAEQGKPHPRKLAKQASNAA